MTPEDEDEEDRGLREQVKEARKTREALGSLLKSPGWIMLERMVEGQCKARAEFVLLTPVDANEIPKQEFTKGEYAGMRLVLKLAQVEYEQAKAIVEDSDRR